MILLTSITDKLQIVTSAAVTTDVHVSWIDNAAGTITPGRTNSAITTATTTDVVAAPAPSVQRNIKTLHVRNKHATTSQMVTIKHTDGTTAVELHKVELAAGQALQYVEGVGFGILESELATALLTALDRGLETDKLEITSVLEGRVSVDPVTFLKGPYPAPISQIKGFTEANIAEVEANTRALRAIRRPRDVGDTTDTHGFEVNRFQMSFRSAIAETTNAGANVGVFGGFCMYSDGYIVVQKVVVSAVLSLLAGARSTGLQMFRYKVAYPCYSIGNVGGTTAYPPGGQTPNQVNNGTPDLRKNGQYPPRIWFQTGTNWTNGSNLYGQISAVRGYGEILGAVRGNPQNVLGNQDLPPTILFDAAVQGPHILEMYRGFIIEVDCPGAVTSYTIEILTTVTWDEWVPTPPFL